MFCLVLPALTLTTGFAELRWLSRMTLAFRPPPDYGSGGQPDVLAVPHIGVRSGQTPLRGGERSCCRLSSVPLPQCPPCPAAVAGVRSAGRAGSRCSAGRVRCPRIRTAVPVAASTWQLDQGRRANPTCAILPSRRNGGCGSAAVLPQPDTAAGVWVAAKPDTAEALAVRCCSRNRRRCPEGRCLDGWCPPPPLPKPVGVHRYRKRSPARRPLDGCRHRRYAWAS